MLLRVELAVVTFQCKSAFFLKITQFQLRLKRKAVDALEHRVLLGAFPVGACKRVEREAVSWNLLGVQNMRAFAQIPERPVAVKRERFALCRQILHLLHLVGLSGPLQPSAHFFCAHLLALKGLPRVDDAAHTLFQIREVLWSERLFEVEVIVEPMLDRWTETELGIGSDFQHGLRQNMGERMPKPINFGSGIESVTGHDVREWQASGLGGGIHWRGDFLRSAFR